jgi:hypothetical protein
VRLFLSSQLSHIQQFGVVSGKLDSQLTRRIGGSVPLESKNSGRANLIAFLVVFALNLPPLLSGCWDAIGRYGYTHPQWQLAPALIRRFNELAAFGGFLFGIPLAGLSILLTMLFVVIRVRHISLGYWVAFAANIAISIVVMNWILRIWQGIKKG